jgi:hypothetical protein
MPTHTISVTVGSDSIQVVPETLTMTSRDEVSWKGAKRFSIVFDDDRAFGRRELDHAMATAVQRPAAKGRFKYSVVSEENPGLRLDPVIIVEEPPTGPHP